METPGRDTTFKNSYRYGFNGKEMDNEPYGQGNEYDYGFRIYNPRVARFLSVDPLTKTYPQLTPYQFASNNPVKYIDLDGREVDEAPDEEKDPWEEMWDNGLFTRYSPPLPPPMVSLTPSSFEEMEPGNNRTDATYNANLPRFRTQTNEEINAEVFKTLDESNGCPLPDFAKNIKPIGLPAISQSNTIEEPEDGFVYISRARVNEMMKWKDVGGGDLSEKEARNGAILEQSMNLTLRELKPNESGDYAIASGYINGNSVAGKTVDEMGPEQGKPYNLNEVLKSLDKHLNQKSADYVLFDMRGLTNEDKDKTNDYINQNQSNNVDRIIKIQ